MPEKTVTEYRIVFAPPWGADGGNGERSLADTRELAQSCVESWPEMGPFRIQRQTITTTDWEDVPDDA